MIWVLGLSLPIPYAEKHPFSLNGKDIKHCFFLPDRRGPTQPPAVKLDAKDPDLTIQAAADLPDPEDSDASFVVTNVAARALVEGDNVLAVEVHQGSMTRGDIVFGTAMFGSSTVDTRRWPCSSQSRNTRESG